MQTTRQITGIILAGGKSKRMGYDKAFAIYDGKSFIQCIMETLQPFVNEIIIVSNNPSYDQFNQRRVNDIIEDAGPLAGLHSGLHHSNTEDNLVLSCDVPLINDALLLKLIEEASDEEDVVQISSQGKTNPLIALYKKRNTETCLKALKSGERRLRSFVNQLQSKTIAVDQSLEKHILNINTHNELKLLNNDIEH